MPYRTLDPITEGPSQTGPSRDWHAIAASEPVYRQETRDLQPKRLPVSLTTTERPRTVKSPIVEMRLGRVPIMVRNSNQRPIEAGVSGDGSVWGVSDPGRWHRPDSQLAADDATGTGLPAPTWGWDGALKARLVGIGVMAGVVIWILRKNKQRGH